MGGGNELDANDGLGHGSGWRGISRPDSYHGGVAKREPLIVMCSEYMSTYDGFMKVLGSDIDYKDCEDYIRLLSFKYLFSK